MGILLRRRFFGMVDHTGAGIARDARPGGRDRDEDRGEDQHVLIAAPMDAFRRDLLAPLGMQSLRTTLRNVAPTILGLHELPRELTVVSEKGAGDA